MRVDPKRELAGYTARRNVFDEIVVPPRRFAMVDGSGDPNTSDAYRDALATLYPFSYALKSIAKRELGRDHVVAPLEALWWADDMASFTTARDKKAWSWTVMILVPEGIAEVHTDAARSVAHRKDAPALDRLRIESFDEGLCIQTLHVGPYDEEGPVLARLHEQVIPERGFRMRGVHHEIYLGDPRRSAPERLRTILRQPVSKDRGR
ncbi:GyrI-like domain-containing protein [Microbacterium sp. SSW1-59]|uniref:GyrI-like domain-containing protein n=1 Tax=Microbacterium xanthum TaxID=3079794 RepID=UPI002AD2E8FB|nr:GyrI-like domain-containing protein [Microbacterium sp. SSW1-59]MDZ8202588.1 GyrI-like domain-containing protein [Microbacterium sp. SSW1-59]